VKLDYVRLTSRLTLGIRQLTAETVMLAETISLGVLALPNAVAAVGLAPYVFHFDEVAQFTDAFSRGLILIAFLGIVAWYTGYIIGKFKLAFPQVCSFADVGEMVAGRIGREIMSASTILILVFIMAAHILSFAIAMNALTNRATCSVVFSVVGLALSFILGLPRKLETISWISALCNTADTLEFQV
jgi:hypothetical protein